MPLTHRGLQSDSGMAAAAVSVGAAPEETVTPPKEEEEDFEEARVAVRNSWDLACVLNFLHCFRVQLNISKYVRTTPARTPSLYTCV